MFAREKILVAEPDSEQVDYILHALHACPHILTASNLAEARQMILTHHPTVLLLEVRQPDGDGMDLIRQLRQDPQTRRLVIIGVIGRSSVREKVAVFQAGADDLISKPISAELLPTRIAILLSCRGGGGLAGTREPRRPYPPNAPPRAASSDGD